MDLRDMSRIVHLTIEENIFFSAAHRTFSKIDILDTKQAF
jgi:hypothetical protein